MNLNLILITLSMILASCSKEESDSKSSGDKISIPGIGALVDKASPEALLSSSSALRAFRRIKPNHSIFLTASESREALKDFFEDDASSISGNVGQGLIRTYLDDLDERAAQVSGNPVPDCMKKEAFETTFSPGVGNHELVLKLSCVTSFGGSGDQSGTGSGMAFGEDDDYFYLYLLLVQEDDSGRFGYAAKVNKSTEEVDLLFLSAFPEFERNGFFHLRTNPENSRYELVYSSTSDSPGPVSENTEYAFSPGVRLVTSATEILVEGNSAQGTDSDGLATPASTDLYAFDENECFSATDLDAAPAACSDEAPTFSEDMELVEATSLVDGDGEQVEESLPGMDLLIEAGISEAKYDN